MNKAKQTHFFGMQKYWQYKCIFFYRVKNRFYLTMVK